MMRNQLPLSAKTTLVGLIGWPVGHSVSPAMHNAAFAALGLDWRYVPLPVDPALPGAVGDAVRGMRAMGLRGINITVPHKQAVLPFLDRIAPAAQAMRAVNTIIVAPDGTLTGDNTDAPGFVADLRAHGVEPAGQRVLVLGAGGSARAIVYGLAQAGATRITVANRSAERAAALLADLRPFLRDAQLEVVALPDGVPGVARDADLIVNCTSLGMTPRADTTPWPADLRFRPDQAVYDLVYNPADTRLLRQAQADGARAIGGLGMLIWQGALAFEHWTGQMPPVNVMRAAAEAHLRRHAAGADAPPTSLPVTIRRATHADTGALARLNATVQAFHANALPTFFKQPSDHTFPPTRFAELLDKPDTVIFLAEVDGEAAGYLYADTTPAMETTSTYALERVWIHHIGVEPVYQRQGVGTALIEATRQLARELGIGTLALSTWSFNARAISFFERQGFESYNYRMWMKVSDAGAASAAPGQITESGN